MNGCEACAHRGTPSYKSPCSECRGSDKYEAIKPPFTNADHIRAMSDEELAEILTKALFCRTCLARSVCMTNAVDDCTKDHLTWLKRPAEEG